jgi:hypothetical protein
MLHLATVEKFATVLTPKFLRLAVVIQVRFDSLFCRRTSVGWFLIFFLGFVLQRPLSLPYQAIDLAATPEDTSSVQYHPVPYCP